MHKLLPLLALLSAGCSGSATAPNASVPPTAATATPSPTPSATTITGRVTATNGGQALAGLTGALGGTSLTTTSTGTFSVQLTPTSSVRLTLNGSGIVPRSLSVAATTSRDVPIDVIAQSGSFDLAFYQQLIRNNADAPGVLQPIRRWTRTPSIYLKTVDEAGEAIHGPTLDLIEATAKDAVPRWTSGLFGTPLVERGTGTRVGVPGWLTIRFPATTALLDQGFCGQAQIGVDGGYIELGYHGAVSTGNGGTCRTSTAVIAPHVVSHEIGHALGFYHTDRAGDLMYHSSWLSPTGLPTDRELYHARIAYSRPVGNVDPDSDPTSAINLAPMTVR